MTQIAMYGALLMAPMIQQFLAHVPAIMQASPLSAIPNACGNDKFAPFDHVWSQPCIAALTEFIRMVK